MQFQLFCFIDCTCRLILHKTQILLLSWILHILTSLEVLTLYYCSSCFHYYYYYYYYILLFIIIIIIVVIMLIKFLLRDISRIISLCSDSYMYTVTKFVYIV